MGFPLLQITKNKVAALLILLVVAYFSLFYHLGYQHMNLWDESSYGMNALEMTQQHNPIEVYLLGQPDLYNTKPPLAIWCMSLAVKIFGFSEKGVRFASAFFAILTALVLWVVGYKVTNKPLHALLMPLILLSSTGYVGEHLARTGDTDAILAFWICVYALCFWVFTSTLHNRNTWFMAFVVCLSCACLTKGIAGLTALPGIVIWAVAQKQVRSLLSNKWFYWGIVLFIVLVPGYYVLRNMLTPGYIQTVLHFEFLGRLERQEFLNPEPRGFWFYYDQFFNNGRLVVWSWLLIPSILVIVTATPGKLKSLSVFLLLILASISVMLGASSTKLFWYDAPLYPMVAGVIGSAFLLLLSKENTLQSKSMIILFSGLFVYPFSLIAQRNHESPQTQHVREAIRAVRENLHYTDTLLIVTAEVNFPAQFYLVQDSLNRGYVGRMIPLKDSRLKEGACFMTCKYEREVDMNKAFILDTLYHQYECGFFRIKGVRETNF